MLTFTLDTNCIIAVDEARPEASAVKALAAAHDEGTVSVALVAISASERQKDGSTLETFDGFKQRTSQLGLGGLALLKPMMYWDLTFWDFGLWSDDSMESLERSIHEVLFPNIPFLWKDYCAALEIDPATTKPDRKWKNAKCDVQAFWSHASNKRDVFVTTDSNFHAETKKHKLLSIAGGRIELPAAAVKLAQQE